MIHGIHIIIHVPHRCHDRRIASIWLGGIMCLASEHQVLCGALHSAVIFMPLEQLKSYLRVIASARTCRGYCANHAPIMLRPHVAHMSEFLVWLIQLLCKLCTSALHTLHAKPCHCKLMGCVCVVIQNGKLHHNEAPRGMGTGHACAREQYHCFRCVIIRT